MDICEDHIDKLAKKIWDYHLMHETIRKADGIFVLGSNDTRVVDRAVELFTQGYAPFIVFSGKVGALTKDLFPKPEAEVFADKAKHLGGSGTGHSHREPFNQYRRKHTLHARALKRKRIRG